MTPAPRSLTGQVLKIHWPTHTPEDGYAVPLCLRGREGADLQPAAGLETEVTCGMCRRMLAAKTKRPVRRRGVDGRRKW